MATKTRIYRVTGVADQEYLVRATSPAAAIYKEATACAE